MKKLLLTSLFLFISILLIAQEKSTDSKISTVKVRPIISVQNKEFCKSADNRKDAIVVEFEVVNEIDKKKFGEKIFAITICEEIPNDSKEIWDLKISEIQYYCWDITIFNEKLLDKNLNKERFWLRDLSRTVMTYCGVKKE